MSMEAWMLAAKLSFYLHFVHSGSGWHMHVRTKIFEFVWRDERKLTSVTLRLLKLWLDSALLGFSFSKFSPGLGRKKKNKNSRGLKIKIWSYINTSQSTRSFTTSLSRATFAATHPSFSSVLRIFTQISGWFIHCFTVLPLLLSVLYLWWGTKRQVCTVLDGKHWNIQRPCEYETQLTHHTKRAKIIWCKEDEEAGLWRVETARGGKRLGVRGRGGRLREKDEAVSRESVRWPELQGSIDKH